MLEKLSEADSKLTEMNQEKFTKFMYSIIMETQKYSNKEAKKILLETEQETAAVLETISGNIRRLSIIVDNSLQTLLSSVEDELALQTLDLKDDLGELFVQQRKNEKKFMLKFDIGVQRLLPAKKARTEIILSLIREEAEETRQEVKKKETKLERYEDAIPKYQQAENILSKNAATLMNLGVALDQTGRFADAIQKYQQADNIRPKNADTLMNWGVTLTKLGRFADAIQKYRQADNIHPEDADTLMNWGITLTKSGRFADAIQKYRQADNIRPEDATTLGNWGIVLEKLKRYEEAQKMYQKAVTAARVSGDISLTKKYEKWVRELSN